MKQQSFEIHMLLKNKGRQIYVQMTFGLYGSMYHLHEFIYYYHFMQNIHGSKFPPEMARSNINKNDIISLYILCSFYS